MKQSNKGGLYRNVMDLNVIESEVYYENGNLFWKNSKRLRKEGEIATHQGNRYLSVILKGKSYKAHRVIFMMHYGWCPQILDHIDGDRYNNRIQNLRMSDYNANNMNAKGNKNTSSKFKGVSRASKPAPDRLWVAQIQFNKKKMSLGRFKTEEEAARAYDTKAKNLFGEFAKLNFP